MALHRRFRGCVGIAVILFTVVCLLLVTTRRGGDRSSHFPPISSGPLGHLEPRIPHIIHQHWIGTQVPKAFSQWMASWVKYHPGWEYWYWTDEDVHRLLTRHYPQYLADYNSYTTRLHKADFMRYFVMHRFGGVYLDLDMESLRPMDEWTFSSGCFLSEETFQHTFFLYNKSRSIVMNCMFACRPNHPFYDYTIRNLYRGKDKPMAHYSTGPFFMDEIYLEYVRSPHNEKDAEIDVIHPDNFLPTYDPIIENLISVKHCNNLNPKQYSLCRKLARQKMNNTPKNASFANHHWFHVRKKSMAWKTSNTVHIKDIVPNYIVPSHRL